VVNGGAHISRPGSNPDTNDPGYMGGWVLGPECGKKIPADFRKKWNGWHEGMITRTASQAVCINCSDVMLSQVTGMTCMKCGTIVPYCSTERLVVTFDDGLLAEMQARFAAQSDWQRHPTGRGWVRRDGEWYLERGAPMSGGGTAWMVHKRHPDDQVSREGYTAYDAKDGQALWGLDTDGAADSDHKGPLYKHIGDEGSLEGAKAWVHSYEQRHTSALDPSLAFMLTATWRDVQNKAKRIREHGGVRIVASQDGTVVGHIRGDHNVYETEVVRMPGSRTSVAYWACGCKWASYSWGRSGPWKKYEGRMCSHALALQYEAQSRGMFGRTLTLDESQPAWMQDTQVRRPGDYDRDKGRYSHLIRPVLPQDDDAAPIMRSARKTPKFPAKVWGRIVNLFVQDGKVIGEDGHEVDPVNVIYPGYDPVKGLNYTANLKESEMSDEEWGITSDLHDVPEPALPTTDGEAEDHDQVTIAGWAGGAADFRTYDGAEGRTTSGTSGPDPAHAAVALAAALAQPAPPVTPHEAMTRIQQADADLAAGRITASEHPLGYILASDADKGIMAGAQAFLEKAALKHYSPAERQQIIAEGEGGEQASNLDRLDLTGTHYEALEARRTQASRQPDAEDSLWLLDGDPNGDL